MDCLAIVRIAIDVVFAILKGFFKSANPSNMDQFTFYLCSAIRTVFTHQLFSVSRYRLMMVVVDYLVLLYMRFKMEIDSVLQLGRTADTTINMYYTTKTVNDIHYTTCTDSITDLKLTDWGLTPTSTTLQQHIFHNKNKISFPKHFKATFFKPKNQHNSKKWLLYVPGGAMIIHNTLLLLKLQNTFPACGIVFVEYSLLPEKAYPCPIVDVLDTYSYMLNVLQISPVDISLIGDSAGGNICLAALLTIKQRNNAIPLPNCAVLLSPWTDLSCCGTTFNTMKFIDYLSDVPLLDIATNGYCGDKYETRNEKYSPVFGNLNGLPRILIQSGELETLLDDNRQLAKKLINIDNRNKHTIYSGMPHDFQVFYSQTTTAAMLEIKEFIMR